MRGSEVSSLEFTRMLSILNLLASQSDVRLWTSGRMSINGATLAPVIRAAVDIIVFGICVCEICVEDRNL